MPRRGPALWDPTTLVAAAPRGRGRTRTRPWASAVLALVLGAASVVIALLEPQHGGVQTGFVVTTIGITALVLGVRAVRAARWGSPFVRALGRGAALLGSVGTALMVYAVIAVALVPAGVQLPPLSLPVDGTTAPSTIAGSDIPAVPAAPAPTAAASAAAPAAADPAAAPAQEPATAAAPEAVPADVPASIDAERSALVQSAGTLAFVMRQQFAAGTYPSALGVGGSAPTRVMLADGTGLAAVPDGTRLLYSVAPDRTSWSVTLIGARFGAVATYSSTIGTVEAG